MNVNFEPTIKIKKLTYNCAHLRSTKEILTIEYLRRKLCWILVKICLGEIFFFFFFVKIFRVKFLGENFG